MAAKPTDAQRGQRIEKLRKEQGWDVADLANRLNLGDRGRIYDWENGDAISSRYLELLAAALGTTRLYIMRGEGPAHPPQEMPPVVALQAVFDALDALEKRAAKDTGDTEK